MTSGGLDGEAALGAAEPAGTAFVFLDESFTPLVAAVAVVVESTEVARLENEVAEIFRKLSGAYYLGGLPSFEEFRKSGFHATANPREVNTAFVAFLSDVLSFKSLIIFSDGSRHPGLTEKRRVIIAFQQLIHDVLRQYRNRPRIVLWFESAGKMDKYVESVVHHVVKSMGRTVPEVEVRFGSKRNPDLLAVPDYVLHVFNQWFVAQDGSAIQIDQGGHASRSFKALHGSISMARSLDGDVVIRRGFP